MLLIELIHFNFENIVLLNKVKLKFKITLDVDVTVNFAFKNLLFLQYIFHFVQNFLLHFFIDALGKYNISELKTRKDQKDCQ